MDLETRSYIVYINKQPKFDKGNHCGGFSTYLTRIKHESRMIQNYRHKHKETEQDHFVIQDLLFMIISKMF